MPATPRITNGTAHILTELVVIVLDISLMHINVLRFALRVMPCTPNQSLQIVHGVSAIQPGWPFSRTG
jgi:hypothetical protein